MRYVSWSGESSKADPVLLWPAITMQATLVAMNSIHSPSFLLLEGCVFVYMNEIMSYHTSLSELFNSLSLS